VNRVWIDQPSFTKLFDGDVNSANLAEKLTTHYYSDNDATPVKFVALFDKALACGKMELPLFSDKAKRGISGGIDEFYEWCRPESDLWFCVDCSTPQRRTVSEIRSEYNITLSVPKLIDSTPSIFFSQKTKFLASVKSTLGKHNAVYALACFAWLQSALKIVSAAPRVDISPGAVREVCLDMIESSQFSFANLWTQRLRLAGLVAHIERSFAFDYCVANNSSSVTRFFPGNQSVPLSDPLGVGVSAQKLLRHEKFSQLDVLTKGEKDDGKKAIQEVMTSSLKKVPLEFMRGDWSPACLV